MPRKTREVLVELLQTIDDVSETDIAETLIKDGWDIVEILIKEGWIKLDEPREFWVDGSQTYEIIHVREVI